MPLSRLLTTFALLVAGTVCAAAGDARHAALQPQIVPLPQAAPAFSAHLVAIGGTAPPVGYVRFCAENASDCQMRGEILFEMPLDRERWSELEQVNRTLNSDIEPMTDLDHYGETERWTYPTDGKGDCEDYVLAKRKVLLAKGWPASVLLITVVRDKEGDGHAVLTVVTDRGDLVLDNQEAEILPWQDTGYRYVKRQSQGDPNLWVSLGETRSPPVVGGGR
ncbi:transglutaminase-like cysteine peptidase [Aquabacter sp. L1I39]|uniref:transglutaminase-like cysteine peptidase n=1 Tax=Aquabacter sp. L1I39 TaxID=2820278 RepID=UPI001ADCB374|nr:transglutaminase-like cysteine peptidase [Aquabacter sp. L1I39]QTL05559.1 transglutaminase-like cysteine peptidase [Aquabacter sp. L1I39]